MRIIVKYLILILTMLLNSNCMDGISDKAKYEIKNIVFVDNVDTIKNQICELEKILKKFPKTERSSICYLIEKTPPRFNIISFNDQDIGYFSSRNSSFFTKYLLPDESTRLIQIIELLDKNGLNGATINNEAIYFNYRDNITAATNWTERILILKRENKATQNLINILDKLDETNDFILLEEP